MPSRGVVAAIFLFWLGSTSLLIVREILPRWRAGVAPAYAIAITDEVGAPQAEWEVFHDDRLVGRGLSQIRRRPEDRTFEMYQRLKFDGFELPVLVGKIVVKKLESTYHITRDGSLLGLRILGKADFHGGKAALPLELEAEMSALVQDGMLTPQLKVFAVPVDIPGMRPISVSEHGSVLNPMHLVPRLPGLREGQRWKIPLIDPFKMFSAQQLIAQPLGAATFPFLDAEVEAANFQWDGQEVPCYRIVYREPGKDNPVAATWVRRPDGLVLAQEAKHHGYDFTIRRLPALP